MFTEVTPTQRQTAPYAQIGFIVVHWADGSGVAGTCSLVGRNDILTATHMIYDPQKGWASSIEFYFGADYNSVTRQFDSTDFSYKLTSGFSWQLRGYPSQVFSDGSSLLTEAETAFDIAIIGVSVPIGDSIGWLGLDPNWNQGAQAVQVGYPVGSTGMEAGLVNVTVDHPFSNLNVYSSNDPNQMAQGSSGGPLLEGNYVIGVKSGGDGFEARWADIGNVYSDLLSFINSDDSMLPATAQFPVVTGTSGADIIVSSSANEQIDGGFGTDVVVLHGSRSQYLITRGASTITVSDQVASRDGTDTLANVERLHFSDVWVAFDVDGNAGQAYRLYQAAFNRTPDAGGLGYQMHALDTGMSLVQVARNFLASPEFSGTYGGLSDVQFATQLYVNVLHRTPDAAGLAYQTNALASGLERAQLLVNFAESPEDKLALIGIIQNGMVFTL